MTATPFNLIWSQNGSIIRGYQNEAYIEGSLVFPVTFPGNITDAQTITLNSSAQADGTLDILSGVKLYLVGDPTDLNTVQGYTPSAAFPPPTGGWPLGWPNLGAAFSPARPEMNGGLQISFDGNNWTTFSSVQAGAPGSIGVGDQSDPSTWILLPAAAIGTGASNGIIGPYDMATIYLRYMIPATDIVFKVFDIQLAVDCDIV